MLFRSARQFTALVLAGSRGPADAVARAAKVSHKALAVIAGKPMLERVLAALAQSPRIGRIIVQCERPDIAHGLPSARELAAQGRFSVLGTGASPAQSVAKALLEIDAPYPLLVTTADHPLLSPAMIEHFLAQLPECDVAVGLAPASVVLAKYPGALRTFYRLGDERWSGCNLFALLNPNAMRAVTYWARLEQFRKRPLRLIAAIATRPLILYALNLLRLVRLDLPRAMEELSAVIGCCGRAVPMPFAEAPIDVDKEEDLALVERILAANRS